MKKTFNVLMLIVLFLLISLNSFTQQDRYYYIQSFEKGLNSQVSKYSVQENQCVIAENVRFNKVYGSLAKRDAMIQFADVGTATFTGLYRYYESDGGENLLAASSTYMYLVDDTAGTFTILHESLSDSKMWQFVTYQDIAIMMNGYDEPLKYDGHTQTTANTDGSRTASNLCAELGAPFAEQNTGANLDASSWYQYKVAFYDGTNYWYSTARSNAILTGTTVRDITLTDIPIGPTGTTARYVYRTLGNSSKANCLADTTYYLVATISNNTTTTVNDAMDDATASADAAPTWATVTTGALDVTPPLGAYCVIHKERLYISGNTTSPSNFYFSDIYNPDYFTSTDYERVRENDGDSITFLKELLGILTIAKTNSIQKYYTDGAKKNWYLSGKMESTGCYAPYSAVNTPIGIIYLSRTGLYRLTGQQSQFISDAVTPEINDISDPYIGTCFGFFHNNEYLLAYTSKESGGTSNNRVLVYDIIRDAYSIDHKTVNVMCSFNAGNDFGDLYYGDSTTGGKIWNESGSAKVLTKYLKSDFNLGAWDDARVYGTETSPIMELSWDCTIDGWLTELQTKDANINTIDDIVTYLPNAIIDRPDTDGSWTSPVYQLNSTGFDTLYWNENLGATGDVTFQVRSGASSSACQAASWSTAVTNPSGSDISGATANSFVQVKINLSTSDIDYTPTLYVGNGYLFKLLYYSAGSTKEGSFASRWRTGWIDLGVKSYPKMIEQIRVFYKGTANDMVVSIKNNRSDVDTSFTIDMSIDPNDDPDDPYTGEGDYKIYTYLPPVNTATTPSLIGQFFQFGAQEEGTSKWIISRIEVQFQVSEDYPRY